MHRALALSAAVFLLVVSVVGSVHSIRAGVAQSLYHEARYGGAKGNPGASLRRCNEAYSIYPHNYRFSSFVAETAYHSSFDEGSGAGERVRLIAVSTEWCEIGLKQNPWLMQLRERKARLLCLSSPREAAAYWAEYVNWDFWYPYNHAVLVDLYSQAGMLEKAAWEMKWVGDSKHYDYAASCLRSAEEREYAEVRRLMKQRK